MGADSRLAGRFDLVRPLGRGGMGIVYEVFDHERGARMALKRVRRMEDDALLRFKDEFRAVRDLNHPNLVRLGELVEHEGQWYFTMELIEGEDFISYVRGAGGGAAARSVSTATVEPPRAQQATAITRRVGARAVDTGPGESTGQTVPARPVDGARPAGRTRGRRAGPPASMARLRDAFAQLATGIAALHRAGTLHCDLKPSNIIVTSEGRVVIIDFGLAVGGASYDDHRSGGTAAYMAPEQGTQASLGPAADWYPVGVMLFEALTGRRPFEDSRNDQLLSRKRALDAPDVRALVGDAPDDLVQLARDLLARDPACRPDERDVLAALRGDAPDAWADEAPAAAGVSVPFVGRDRELAALERAADEAASGRCVAVFLEGPSGVGKSATVRELLRRMRQRDPTAAILQGRCHEKEAVPYNAFDGVIDRLTELLRHVDREQRAELTGDDLELIARLFPAVRALVRRPPTDPDGARSPPSELRRRAFDALRELLRRIAATRPVIVAIDDIQWADAESLSLLAELCRPPAAVPMLVVATARQPAGSEPSAAAAAAGANVHRYAMSGLVPGDARRLIAELSDETVDVDEIVAETEGHPMFIEELVRHARRADAGGSLDDALRARVARLATDVRELVEAVAAAGAPIARAVAANAARLDPDRFAEAIAVTRAARLLRIRGTRANDTVEPFHARVREAVYRGLAPDRRSHLHRELAGSLEREAAPPELIAHHLAHCGESARSAQLYAAAARNALEALAFERAASLFESALACGEHAADDRRRLLQALGDALSHAGRPGDGGRAYLAAQELANTANDRRELLRRTTECFLTGGYLEPGLDATRRLLGEHGLRLPRTRAGAIVALLYQQTRLDRHNLTWTARPAGDIPTRDRALMDVCWSVGVGLGMVDSVRGALFVTRGARVCLATGDELRIARVLSAVTFSHAALGRLPRVARLLAACRRAAESDESTLARCYYRLAQAGATFLADNDWRACLDHCRAARELWREAGRRGGYEADVIDQLACWSINNQGRMRALRARVPERIRAAQLAGDRFVEVSFRAFFVDVHLAVDDADAARRDVRDAIDSWLPGHTTFGNQDYLALRSLTHIALYAGDVDDHAAELEPRWRGFFRSLMSRLHLLRADGLGRSGAFALARAFRARARGDEGEARGLARRARRAVRALERIPIPWARNDELHLRAAVADFDGDDEGLRRALRAAMTRADEHGMALNAACLRRRLGLVLGGSEGAELVAQGDEWAREEGVVNLARFTDALIPSPILPTPGETRSPVRAKLS